MGHSGDGCVLASTLCKYNNIIMYLYSASIQLPAQERFYE